MQEIKRDLIQGKVAIGLTIGTPSPTIAEVVGRYYDWLFIDMEHSPISFDVLPDIVRACDGTNTASIVRVPKKSYERTEAILDLGVDGIIFPHLRSREDARAAVEATKYPPLGSRSVGYGRALDYGEGTVSSFNSANETLLTVGLIEDEMAIEEIENIVSVDGMDAVFIGPLDLFADKGMLTDAGPDTDFFDIDRISQDIQAVKDAVKLTDTILGLPADDADSIATEVSEGVQLIITGTEYSLLNRAMADVSDFRDSVPERKTIREVRDG